jgi:hypothetical protein
MMLFAILAATAAGCAVPGSEISRQLSLAYDRFDTEPGKFGWRQLNGRGCTDSALALLARYEAANGRKLPRETLSEIQFHAGQALAFAGRNAEAIPHFVGALRLGGTEEWTSFVAANVAFLKRDPVALRKARDRYAAVAPKSMRLKFLDGFIACPTADYMKAAYCAQ